LRPLLSYARYEIRAYEALGALHRGEVQPEDIVDAALLEAGVPAGSGAYPTATTNCLA
jgi:hypothetical protein